MAKTLEELFPHKFSVGDTVKVVARGESEWCKIGDIHKVRVCQHNHEDGAVYVVDDDDESAYIRECNLELVERDRQNGGEWKRHRGNSQPVDEGTWVEVKLRCGDIQQGLANEFLWRHADCDVAANIMKFRVISQPQAEEVPMIAAGDTREYKGPFPCAPAGEPITELDWDIQFQQGIFHMEAKTDQIDGPILWRDTVNELDAYIEEFTREREALIERLASEGFALIPPVVSVVSEFSGVDFSDWRNWKAGDVVESREKEEDIHIGEYYLLTEDVDAEEGEVYFKDSNGDARHRDANKYRFISRP